MDKSEDMWDQQQALKHYLTSMLRTPTSLTPKTNVTTTLLNNEAHPTAAKLITKPVLNLPELQPFLEPVDLTQQTLSEKPVPTTTPVTSSVAPPTEPFQILLFEVSGLTLAVPLTELAGIHKLTQALTPIIGQPKWCLGLLNYHGSNIHVANTADWVLPEAYRKNLERLKQPNYAIFIQGIPWAFACDNIATAVTVRPEQIKWRASRAKRAWLAGTVLDHMCALLDVAAMGRHFSKGPNS